VDVVAVGTVCVFPKLNFVDDFAIELPQNHPVRNRSVLNIHMLPWVVRTKYYSSKNGYKATRDEVEVRPIDYYRCQVGDEK
jgi:hypothetical protein